MFLLLNFKQYHLEISHNCTVFSTNVYISSEIEGVHRKDIKGEENKANNHIYVVYFELCLKRIINNVVILTSCQLTNMNILKWYKWYSFNYFQNHKLYFQISRIHSHVYNEYFMMTSYLYHHSLSMSIHYLFIQILMHICVNIFHWHFRMHTLFFYVYFTHFDNQFFFSSIYVFVFNI